MSDALRHTQPPADALTQSTRNAPPPAPFNPTNGASLAPLIEPQTIVLCKLRPPYWAHDLPDLPRDLSYDRYGPEIARRLATFCDEIAPSHPFTATELQCFAHCPNQFRWRHQFGAKNGRVLAIMPDQLERHRVNESRGRIIHLYLQRHKDGWSEATVRDKLRDTIARCVDYPLATPEQYVDEFMPDVQHVLASDQYELLRTADEVHRETAITVRIPGQPGCEIEARPDVMFRRHKRWYIIDYKTANLSSSPNPLHALLEDTLRYELQAALYLIALRRCMGKHAVESFTFLYTAHGVAVQETPTDPWLDGVVKMLPPMVRWIQQENCGPEAPVWSARKCIGCDFRDTVCKPVGDPEGTPRPQDRP